MSRSVLRGPEPDARAVRASAGRARRLLRALLAGVATGAAVVAIALLVRGQWQPLVALDQRAVDAGVAYAAPRPALLRVLNGWQWAFQPVHLLVPVAALCLLYWWRTRDAPRLWWALATVLVAWGLSNVMKELVRRARPMLDQPVERVAGYSFPSGHAANTAAMTTTLVVLAWPLLRSPGRRIAAVAGAAVLTLLTAADRVLLGAHFPTDVAAGVLFGFGFVMASYLAFRHWSPPRSAPGDETGEGA